MINDHVWISGNIVNEGLFQCQEVGLSYGFFRKGNAWFEKSIKTIPDAFFCIDSILHNMISHGKGGIHANAIDGKRSKKRKINFFIEDFRSIESI